MMNIIINEIIIIIVLQLCSVLIAVIAIIIYRVSVTLIMYQVASRWDDKPQFLTVSNTKLLISMSAACMNLLVIIIFNKVSKYIIISRLLNILILIFLLLDISTCSIMAHKNGTS